MVRLRLPALIAAGTVILASAACGSEEPSTSTGSQEPIAVTSTDTECRVARTEAKAGTIVFKVTNGGSKPTEFYVYGEGDRVLAEVENIGPGLSRDLHAELAAGQYQTACKPGMTGNGIRGTFTVTGTAAALADDAVLAAATATYQTYVRTEADALLTKTRQFVDAVRAGDVARAKSLYPLARTHWERIEPVAEIFGDLDPKIDGREDVVEEGMEFTGFHRLERDLWVTADVSRSGAIADQLMADVKAIVAKANAEKLSPLQLANGAKELLDEVATGKITGEENRYSHTDLWDFDANVEGSKAAIQALRPALEKRAPDLVKALDENFTLVETVLGRHAVGGGWKLHNQLTAAQLKELSDAINALAEPISKVAAAISGR